MVFFELLIGASVKAVKDFISHCYSRLKSIYYSLKRWLWEIQGKFKAHDAFVNMCYGHMADIEDFEIPLADEFVASEEELAMAQAKLKYMVALEAESGVEDAYTQLCIKKGYHSLTTMAKPTKGELAASTEALEAKISSHYSLIANTNREYIKNKGKGYINTFNSLFNRLHFVKKEADLAKENEDAAWKMQQQLFSVENIQELHDFTEVAREENGCKKMITKLVNNEEIQEEVPVKVEVRRIKCSEQAREKAAIWIRAYIKVKNSTLTADELSMATISKYVENLCEKHSMSAESRTYLTKCACLMVPLPTREEIDIKMTIQSPAARSRREQIEILDAQGF
nr:RNA-dependent RNA polymerase P1 [Barley yellow dwarf virus-kerII]